MRFWLSAPLRVKMSLLRVIFSYNHADWYVKLVLGLAARYS